MSLPTRRTLARSGERDKLESNRGHYPLSTASGTSSRDVVSQDVVSTSKTLRPKRGKHSVHAEHVPEEKLFVLSGRLLSRLVADAEEPMEGRSWNQLMRLAREEAEGADVDTRALTVLVDRLTDNGLVVTNARQVSSSGGEPYVIRVFAPEGEVVSAKIRQQIMVRSFECLAVT